MKLTKHLSRVVVITILIVVSLFLITRVDAVQATFSDIHVGVVLLRVESELMQKTPAGQYYEALFYKHSAEIFQVATKYPENDEAITHAMRVFTPALEALVDGRGDEVQITPEQVDILKAQLDFYVQVGSPALREDIEKEQNRLQLDHFAGMTMNEAWDFINSTWMPDTIESPTLFTESDGRWAYYVFNNVYLEYPSNFFVQESGIEKDTIFFIPSSSVSEQWNPCVIKIHIWEVPVAEKDTANSFYRYSPDRIMWDQSIQNVEFSGIEFVSSTSNHLGMNLRAFQYSQESQIAVDIWVFVNENLQPVESVGYSELINQRYEYFQHMVDSLRVQLP